MAQQPNGSTAQQLNVLRQIFQYSADKMTETVVSVPKTL